MDKYRVEIVISGGISRPYYDGHVDVWVEQPPAGKYDLRHPAFHALRRTGIWNDITMDDVKVQSFERLA